MARGVASPAAQALPKVSFVKIEDDVSTQPSGVHDNQARIFGYNDFEEFRRPEHYIRHIEPLESELAVQVEYDMDEQDQEWLDSVNAERKREQMDKVSYELFEIIMDRLEKEWFNLTKNITKPDLALPSEDSTCAICDDSEGENSNAIVFCDGCNLAVHQDCYGVPYIPEGQWLCRKCTVSPENPVSCILCPREGGAFKQTIHGEWVHLLCAIWVPETRVANDVFMEPITDVDKISKQRWKLKCSVCEIREGACIQCAKTSCFLAFHATCARKENFLMPMKSTHGSEPVTLTCYCERHLPKEQYDARMAALEAEGEESEEENNNLSKSARAYAKTYKPGPPLVPAIVVNRIMQYTAKINVRKKQDFLWLICKYWSLKREARRGAPLLKRLHLEPWTASAGTKQQTDEEKAMKLQQLNRLRDDLVKVHALAELSRKREARKALQAEAVQTILTSSIFAHEPALRHTFEMITIHDKNELFKIPVSKTAVPDYFDIIRHPMCWSIIDSKLDRHEYWDIEAFKSDIRLVISNALLYNKPGDHFHKAALRIQKHAEPRLAELDRLAFFHPQPSNAHEVSASADVPFSFPPVGDLELPLEFLELLISEDTIKEELELILETSPISSLLSYELGKVKPPPPPPPTPPPPPPKLVKSTRKNFLERKRAERAAAASHIHGSPGFRAPRTRRAIAALAAFEAEAGGNVELTPPAVLEPTKEEPEATTSITAADSTGDTGTMEMPQDLEVAESSTHALQKVPKKRVSSMLSGQAELPPVMDHVDKRDSFKHFEAGWILPENSRRRGRAPVPPTPTPVSKKRARISDESSRLSVTSTPAAEQAPKSTPPPIEEERMEVDSKPEQAPAEIPTKSTSLINTPSLASAIASMNINESAIAGIIHAPDGTIIIEEIDSPAIRHQKSMRRKAEKKRLAAEVSSGGLMPIPPDSAVSTSTLPPLPPPPPPIEPPLPVAGPSRLPLQDLQDLQPKDADMQSDLSSLSDIESDDETSATKAPPALPPTLPPTAPIPLRAIPVAPSPNKDPDNIILAEGEVLESGTLVWAKADTYPWWPAVIFDPDDPSIPLITHTQKTAAPKKKGYRGPIHAVRFYDKNNTWTWVGLDRLKLLGESDRLDEDLLAPNSIRQRWKSGKVRSDCRDSFRRAVAERETASDLERDQNPEIEAEQEKGNEVPKGEGVPENPGVQEPQEAAKDILDSDTRIRVDAPITTAVEDIAMVVDT